jgi:NAD(P)-dependent dehydrogenase (short-subunit alcohol dehydrogenase family)
MNRVGSQVAVPVAIVTGSDSGIGKATAVALADAGFDVGVTFHSDEDGARGTVSEVEGRGRRAALRKLDVASPTDARGMVDDLAGDLGGLDAFVNNAGTGVSTPFLEQSLDDWQRVLDTNLTGAFVAAQRAAQIMVDAGTPGAIVNITSVHEHIPLPGSAAYCASKGGLGLLTKVMALELGERGIRVNAVAPGEIATPMTGQHDEDPGKTERPALPLKRPGHADEVGRVVAFLCTGDSSYMTGASIVVDGGLMLIAAAANMAAA